MATREYQVSFKNANALPEDRYVNVLYFLDAGSTGHRQAIMNGIAGAYQTHMQNVMTGDINSLNIRCYPLGLNQGGPELESNYVFPGGSGDGPQEVALCLSYYATFNQPRRRGRIYLGPFGKAGLGGRPDSIMLNKAKALGQAFGAGWAASGGAQSIWQLHSRTPASNMQTITNYWVDNAWDTLRSRGIAPTSRVSGSV
jgi:hypothetical protein